MGPYSQPACWAWSGPTQLVSHVQTGAVQQARDGATLSMCLPSGQVDPSPPALHQAKQLSLLQLRGPLLVALCSARPIG